MSNSDLSTEIGVAIASILSAKNDASGPTDSRSKLQNAYFARNNNTISPSIKDITAINIKIFDNFDEAFKDATANAKVPGYYYVTIINKKDGTYETTVEVPTDFIGTH